jgi:hypothetical protein
MLISKWRPRAHRYFGTIHVPIVETEIRRADGRYLAFALCVDSGAVISLLPNSAAVVLSLDLPSGRAIKLGGVQDQHIDAWVHNLNMRFGEMNDVVVPVAIAAHDRVPALLGRLGVFDRFEITFDPANRATRIVSQ